MIGCGSRIHGAVRTRCDPGHSLVRFEHKTAPVPSFSIAWPGRDLPETLLARTSTIRASVDVPIMPTEVPPVSSYAHE